jgi:hypothetical protein
MSVKRRTRLARLVKKQAQASLLGKSGPLAGEQTIGFLELFAEALEPGIFRKTRGLKQSERRKQPD